MEDERMKEIEEESEGSADGCMNDGYSNAIWDTSVSYGMVAASCRAIK